MEGKTLNRFPIFGGHWKLPYVMRTMSIDQIILVNHRMPAEALRRVLQNAEESNTLLRVFRMRLEEFPIEVHAASLIVPVSKTTAASAQAVYRAFPRRQEIRAGECIIERGILSELPSPLQNPMNASCRSSVCAILPHHAVPLPSRILRDSTKGGSPPTIPTGGMRKSTLSRTWIMRRSHTLLSSRQSVTYSAVPRCACQSERFGAGRVRHTDRPSRPVS